MHTLTGNSSQVRSVTKKIIVTNKNNIKVHMKLNRTVNALVGIVYKSSKYKVTRRTKIQSH
jgi:hypothetical protein